ncbi:MAG: hypothetical protein ACRDO8_00500 [Nocardioidaceae bacterium]
MSRSTEDPGTIAGWVRGRLPDDWFDAPAEVTIDREEITVVGSVAEPDGVEGDDAEATEARRGRIARFREETRDARIAIAREAEHRFGRKVAWGAACGGTREVFTNLAVPAMTRLRQPERRVLDTLVASGVARSRSEALGWCVKLVGQHTESWLADLREAMSSVERVREQGPPG